MDSSLHYRKKLPNSSFLVRKIGTEEAQVLHRIGMHQVTPREPLPDLRILPQEWKPDLEANIMHDDLYARAWECEYERPNFDAKNNNARQPS